MIDYNTYDKMMKRNRFVMFALDFEPVLVVASNIGVTLDEVSAALECMTRMELK